MLSKVLLNTEQLNVYKLCLLSGVEQLGDHCFLFFTVLLSLKTSCYISLCDWIHFYCHDMYCLCQIIVMDEVSDLIYKPVLIYTYTQFNAGDCACC